MNILMNVPTMSSVIELKKNQENASSVNAKRNKFFFK